MSEQSYGLQESPTTVKHLLGVIFSGALFAVLAYVYEYFFDPAGLAKKLSQTSVEACIIGICFFSIGLIFSLMTGKILTRYGPMSIEKSKYLVTFAQVFLAFMVMVYVSYLLHLMLV